MTIEYALREGFLDLRSAEMGENGERPFSLLIKKEAEGQFDAIETAFGVLIKNISTGESRLIDADLVGEFSAPMAVLENLDVYNALQAWNLGTA